VWTHAQLEARSGWREIGTPSGPVRALLPPLAFAMGDVPSLGQHTDEVLAELGDSDAETARLW
jgi:itaconate CoA-transferase